jgi:hypothetical protein
MKYIPQPSRATWLAQCLILLVAAWNLQAGLAFIFAPEQFAPGFMLTGVAGAAAVRGVGVLFLMWNVPYLVALWNPQRYFLALQLAVAMQAVGLVGESYILSTLTAEYAALAASITRFATFDGIGLLLLLAAFLLVRESLRQET